MFYGTDHRYMDILHQVILCKQGMLMCIHTLLLTECVITQITGILTLATMYMLMSVQIKSLLECFFYTHHMNKDTGHYV